jgi:hypothetical protein
VVEIKEYIYDRANQTGVKLSKIILTDGTPLGCYDSCLLELNSEGQTVNTLVSKLELVQLKDGSCTDLLELKVDAVLMRLRMLQET